MKLYTTLFEKFGKVYPANTVIFREGEKGDTMYILVDGEVMIVKKTKDKHKVLRILKKGEIFGEMSVIDGRERSASAITRKEAKVIAISRKLFFEHLIMNKDVVLIIIRTLIDRLRQTNELISEIVSNDHKTQMIKYLIEYGDIKGKQTVKGIKISLVDFLSWVKSNGFDPDEAQYFIEVFKKNRLVMPSVTSKDHIILSYELMKI